MTDSIIFIEKHELITGLGILMQMWVKIGALQSFCIN
jgi:hypothetical protein